MAAGNEQSAGPAVLPQGGAGPASPQPYDFRHPACLSAAELRALRAHHEEFARALTARLSLSLGLDCRLRLAGLETVPRRKFIAALPDLTHLSFFKAEPLRGVGLLELPPRLGLALVDGLLGGTAEHVAAVREFSEIEHALLDQALQLILDEWCRHWSGAQELHATLLGHESGGAFLQSGLPDAPLLLLDLEVRLGGCAEHLRLAFPSQALQPLLRQFDQTPPPPVATRPAAPAKWNHAFDDVCVPVTARWPDLELTARALTRLKVGDVLSLEPDSKQRIQLRLADHARFEGCLGTAGGHWAVSISSVVRGAP